MAFSISDTNFFITGLPTELQTLLFATWQGVSHGHTNRNNLPYLQAPRIQIFLGMPVY